MGDAFEFAFRCLMCFILIAGIIVGILIGIGMVGCLS